jgi:hypothetical protein
LSALYYVTLFARNVWFDRGLEVLACHAKNPYSTSTSEHDEVILFFDCQIARIGWSSENILASSAYVAPIV